jgi:alkylation response protein AidB-like acyl-CoA dehydrogenase
MDFGFSEEQELLRTQARDFLDRECDTRTVRRLMEEPAGFDDKLYGRMAGLGWTAVPFPETHGGLGLGLVDLVVVLEEMGRHVTPGPLQSSVALAGMTVLRAGSEEQRARWLPAIADGSRRATVAVAEASGHWDASGVTATATRSGDAWLLNGEKWYVPDAHVADWIVVAARTSEGTSDGLSLLVVDPHAPGVELRRLTTMDPTQRLFQVRLDGVEVPVDDVVGEPGRGGVALRTGLQATLVAVSAELCGVAQRALEMSVEYAKARHQFGRPIGTYQGVSHKCADMLVLTESAKSLTYHAAWAVDEDAPEAPLAAAMAKAYVSDAARQVTSMAIQVHGGIGFTWEHDIHLYFKRAKWGEVTYGDARHWRGRVADLLEL